MKLITVFLLLVGISSASAGYAQQVTLREENAPLQEVLRKIKDQTGYMFLYTGETLQKAGRVNLSLRKVPVEEALRQLFLGQPNLTYTIEDKTVIIRPNPVLAVPVETAEPMPPPPIEVKGRVTDEQGQPLAGLSVTVKGTTHGTSTDNNGNFTLSNVDENATLVITGVTIEPMEIKVNGRTTIAVKATTAVKEEEVVVAYGTRTKTNNVAAVTVVKGEQIQNLPYRSVDKSLQGLVPGLLVTSGTGQPGGGLSNFVLRGIATGGDPLGYSTARNPLIVVDGIPVTQDNFQWTADVRDAPVINPMAQLNPSDIESITVLKDAAAVALYGARSSNGVILITTKQGKAGKTRFSFRHQSDIASRLNGNIQLLNRDQYMQLLFETYKNAPRSVSGVTNSWTDQEIVEDLKSHFPTRSDGSFYPATNWLDEIYSNHPLSFSNELSMSGGSEKNAFYLNLEYTKQEGVYKKTGFDRKSLRFNFENRPAKWLKIGMRNSLSYNIQDYATLVGGTFPLGIATYYPPLNPARNEQGDLILNYAYPFDVANPIAATERNIHNNTSYRALSKIYGEIKFLRDFTFTSSLGIDYMMLEAKERIAPELFDYVTKSFGGRFQERTTRNTSLITNNILRFDKTVGSQHSISILLGQEAQIFNSKLMDVYTTDLGIQNQVGINTGGSGTSSLIKQNQASFFGQANYNYKQRYFLTGSIRRDGNSSFGINNLYGNYWSSGAGWLVTNESFMSSSMSWLNYLKIRGSIGAAGNASAINSLTKYDLVRISSFQNNLALIPYLKGNYGIQWEKTFSWDAGIEAQLLNNRIAITADVYKRKTTNVIFDVPLAPINGVGSISANIGDMSNFGVELSISADAIKNQDFRWNIQTNWSTNKNVLVKANVPLALISGSQLANEEGRNFNSFYMARWAGVNPADGSPQWIDSTGKPNSNFNAAKKQWVGKPQPDAFGAFTNNFYYKNFELSVVMYFQYGFQVYNTYTLTQDGFNPYFNQDIRALDFWKKPGDITANPKRYLNNLNGVVNVSTRHLYDGDFIRLQTLSLSFRFPKDVTDRLHINGLRIYAQGHNLAVWTSFPGADINDVNSAGGVNISYPNQKNYSLGLNLDF